MRKFKQYNTNNQQKYIRIKTINLGAVAASTIVESSLFNNLKTYNIIHAEDVNEASIRHFINDSDIVFLVADLDDDFVVKNILKITEILSNNEKIFSTILANADTLEVPILWIQKSIRDKSSLLVVENQDDISIKSESTISQKFKKIIYSLCDLIDVEIKELYVQETILSSLISLNTFFGEKCDLYLYVDYTEDQVRLEVEENLIFYSLMEESNQVCIRHPFFTEDQESNNKIYNFIDFCESIIDEDTDCYLSPKIHTNTYTEFSVLIAISNNMNKSIS